MNMDEFWDNIWTAEEGQAMAAAMIGKVYTAPDSQNNLQQENLTLPRTLTRKTMDEVWKEMQRRNRQQEQKMQQQHWQWPGAEGNMTLEDFLNNAGVIRDDTGVDTTANNGAAISFASTFGVQTPQAKAESIMKNQQQSEWYNYQPNQQQQQAEAAAATMAGVANRTGPIGGMFLPGKIDNMFENPLYIRPRLVLENLASSSSPSPDLATSAAPDTPTKRPIYDVLDIAVERRQRRMTKNRESAARSRARKQAYTVELEAEVIQLKEQILQLKRQRAFGPEQDLGKPPRVLQRTYSTSW
ncbi:hypothetical protein O6H91_10G017200 [Diphasiastrum complanatum]|uniref:Uncharacterized protein n=1 Tax=Diphasiastrum complanatum TaxID=34168 RepID=A0ACC2CEP2_DIPCM|nr:hypothetical protein O6H91_10G017200 [Diphasiastrum complanatum]